MNNSEKYELFTLFIHYLIYNQQYNTTLISSLWKVLHKFNILESEV